MKKIIFIFLCILSYIPNVGAEQILVENVFSDIDANYEYRDELQLFYDRGIIVPNASGVFSPNSYLNRDEFVGISMEVICKRCIQPQTEYQFIEEYLNKDIYFDIDNTNPYFYCVAEADKQNYVRGYDIGESCENGTNEFGERPFCPLNRINLEEAIAVLLRNSGIFTIADNSAIVNKIRLGEINNDLSKDVSPKDDLGNPYTFYGYLQKALNFEIVEYDNKGNEKILKLLEVDSNGNINPKKSITKQDFLQMAYIALKSNGCSEIVDNNLALSIDIWNKSCTSGDLDCEVSQLNDPIDTYDFTPDVEGFCESGINSPSGYSWRFYNTTNGVELFYYGLYLDDIQLPSSGEWKIYLRVQDACGNTGQVYSTIVVNDNIFPNSDLGASGDNSVIVNNNNNNNNVSQISLNVDILVEPIIGLKDLKVDFESIVYGGIAPYSYSWIFGDNSVGIGKYIEHLFTQTDVFEVELTVTDSAGLDGTATVLIKVLPGSCNNDSDGDGGNDCEDYCPLVPGDENNKWCPIFEVECDSENLCSGGYECNYVDSSTPDIGVCLPVEVNPSCLYSSSVGAIFGNTTCNTCPCSSSVDFLSDIRRCDIVFPAITSPNAEQIYSKGKIWQIQQ